MQIWKSTYVIVFIWKPFHILNPKNSRVKFVLFLKINKFVLCRSTVFIVDFEYIFHLFLVFLLLTMKM